MVDYRGDRHGCSVALAAGRVTILILVSARRTDRVAVVSAIPARTHASADVASPAIADCAGDVGIKKFVGSRCRMACPACRWSADL